MMKTSSITRLTAFLRSCFVWDSVFAKWVAMVALPIILQNIVGASLNILDSLMVSGLGDAAYSAVTQANRFSFVFNLFCFGTASGGAIFMSQYWGAQDIPRMRQSMGLCMSVILLLSGLFTAAALLFPGQIISLFLPAGESHELAVVYLTTVAPSFVLMGINTVYATCLKAGEKTHLPLITGIIGMAIDTVLNYAFIYGKLGFEPMGVYGAASSTIISSAIQLVLIIIISHVKHLPAGATPRQMIPVGRDFVRKFNRTVIPVIFNEGFWALGTTMYGIYYGSMGDIAVAATGICSTVDNLVWVIIFGMMHATAIIVGKTLGAGKLEEAYLYAKRMIAGAMLAGLVLGGVLILIRGPVLSVFGGLSAEAISKANTILLFGALTMWFRAFNTINVVGVLRSGGDTVFSLLLDVGSMWVIGVPLCALATYVFHLPVEFIYLCTFAEEIAKFVIGIPHFNSRKWINNLTEQKGEPALECN